MTKENEGLLDAHALDATQQVTATEWPPCPELTVDLVVIAGAAEPHVLLIERGDAPYQGGEALPGGYTVAGESLTAAVRREVAEETGRPGGRRVAPRGRLRRPGP